MKNNLKLLAIALIGFLIVFAGCKKTDSTVSIVGLWTMNTERQVMEINGVTQSDTTVNLSAGTSINLTSAGRFISAGSIGPDTGTYVQANGQLTLHSSIDTSVHVLLINSLTANNMQLEMNDTGNGGMAQYYFNLTR